MPEEEKGVSGPLEEEIGSGIFKKEITTFFFSLLFSLNKDYITTVYPA